MSCWQRPDWTQFFECAYDHLAEPVYIWFPLGIGYLVIMAMSAATGVTLYYLGVKIFGRDVVSDAFGWVFDRIGDAVWYTGEWCRRRWDAVREAPRPAGQAGETPAGRESSRKSRGSRGFLFNAKKLRRPLWAAGLPEQMRAGRSWNEVFRVAGDHPQKKGRGCLTQRSLICP